MAHISLRIDLDATHRLGPGKVRLLELIGEHGSISAASRAMGMSYRRAWSLVESLNTLFGRDLTTTRVGGAGGGKAELTPAGRDVVRCYRAIEARASAMAETELAGLLQSVSPAA